MRVSFIADAVSRNEGHCSEERCWDGTDLEEGVAGDDLEEALEAFSPLLDDLVREAAAGGRGCGCGRGSH